MTLPEQRRSESAVSVSAMASVPGKNCSAAGAEAVFDRIEEVETYIEE